MLHSWTVRSTGAIWRLLLSCGGINQVKRYNCGLLLVRPSAEPATFERVGFGYAETEPDDWREVWRHVRGDVYRIIWYNRTASLTCCRW